jgi:hypothetical protein
MKTACWRRGVLVGVQSALLAAVGAAGAAGESRETCLSGTASKEGVTTAASTTLPGAARNEFAVKYVKGKSGFGGKMHGVLVLSDDRVCFRNRRGDREFTIVRESAQAQVTTKQKLNIGCWFGVATLALGTGMVDPDQACRRTEYLVEVAVAGPGGPERVVFKAARSEASELAAAINTRSGWDERPIVAEPEVKRSAE